MKEVFLMGQFPEVMTLRLREGTKARISGVARNEQEFIRGAIEAALGSRKVGSSSRVGTVGEQREAQVAAVKGGRKAPMVGSVSPGVSVYGKILLSHLEKKPGGRSKRRHLRGDLGWVDADLMPAVVELKGLGLIGADTEEVWLV